MKIMRGPVSILEAVVGALVLILGVVVGRAADVSQSFSHRQRQ